MCRRRGFTLVELLVVVAILSLLLSILTPSLRRAKVFTQRTQCLARQRTIGQALSGYAAGYRSIYPVHSLPDQGWADAYSLRTDYPYSGKKNRYPLGLGLLVSTGQLPSSGLGEIVHCPSFNNLSSTVAPGHCMDVAHPWGYGGSGWGHEGYRIIGSYNYRGTSFGWVYKRPLHMGTVQADCVMLIDTPDLRMRGQESLYNAHGGYNRVFADGGGSFFDDPQYEVDAIALEISGGTVDGRRGASEVIFEYLSIAH